MATSSLWFQAAYGLGFLFFGRLVDRIGAKMGLCAGDGPLDRCAYRPCARHLAPAASPSSAFPGAGRIRHLSGRALAAAGEWFPKRERALAIGIFNAGANVGAVVAPLDRADHHARAGLAGGLHRHRPVQPRLDRGVAALLPQAARASARQRGRAGLYRIRSDRGAAARWPGRRLLATRQAWAYMAGRFLIDPVWWTFLFWLPDFFAKRYGVDLKNLRPAAGRHLCDGRCRLGPGRLVFVAPARARRRTPAARASWRCWPAP